MFDANTFWSAAVGALFGAVASGLGAYVSFAKIVAVLQTQIQSLKSNCDNCQIRILRLENKQMGAEG
jgi:hypothetical protein